MINSINSQAVNTQNYARPNKVDNSEPNTVKTSENTSEKTNIVDTRKDLMSLIEGADPKKLTSQLSEIKQFGHPTAIFNLKNFMSTDNSAEVMGRIDRATKQFEQEAAVFHTKQLDIIQQGEADGKSAKEVLTNIVSLTDEQSELFKMSTNWDNKGLSAPENYEKLVELTSSYVNYFA
jgi:hypothetical protein